MNSARRSDVILALACAVAGSAFVAGPAQAQSSATPSRSTLVLSVAPDQQSGTSARTALLRCDTDGGVHAAATAACDDLRAVTGDIGALAAGDGICTYEYAPVTAAAVGVWRGRPLSYRATFPNRCALLQHTGDVFNF